MDQTIGVVEEALSPPPIEHSIKGQQDFFLSCPPTSNYYAKKFWLIQPISLEFYRSQLSFLI